MAQSRRDFLGSAALGAAGLGSVWGCAPPDRAGSARADLVVLNATVHTMDDADVTAQAFAVRGDRFVAVGRNDEIEGLAGRDTVRIDGAGLTAVPGFIDAHCHPDGVEELTTVNVNLGSIAAIKDALRARAGETPPDTWVSGHMYDDTKLEEGRPLSRADLDEAVPGHPVSVIHRGGHTGVFNSKAFAIAGVREGTPDPEHGKLYRENGRLTGKVAERALELFSGVGRRPEISRAVRQAAVKHISGLMAKAGLTSVHMTYGGPDDLTALQDAYLAGEMSYRMYFFPGPSHFRTLAAAGVRTGFGNANLRIGAVKHVADGSASERTMRMSTPYVGRPNDFGILTMTPEDILEAVEEAHRRGWQVAIHANGDVTIGLVLDAYERALREWPRPDPRHRIEHCSLVNPTLLSRIKAAGAIPAPFYTYIYYHGEKWVEYGEEKMQSMFAHRSFLDAGIPVAPASDYMPGPYEPLMAMQSMVTRTDYRGRTWGGNQRIAAREALRICTRNGAYASFEEGLKGSIEAGKLADFVLLGADPLTADPSSLKDIPVVRTVLGGRTTHEA
ncbi:MAG: amidohydrolase [Gemmatimonadales bacterium]